MLLVVYGFGCSWFWFSLEASSAIWLIVGGFCGPKLGLGWFFFVFRFGLMVAKLFDVVFKNNLVCATF